MIADVEDEPRFFRGLPNLLLACRAVWVPSLLCFRNGGVMRRIRIFTRALIGATVVAGGMAALAPVAQAITIPVACSENALVAAVNLANSTAAADTLVLAGGCTYGLTSPHGGPTKWIAGDHHSD
jgi:hypothetical protein